MTARGMIAIATISLMLAACGTNTADRTEGGAATGAAAGAVIGAACCFLVGAIPGAIVGGAIGAGTGYATTPDQVDLGKPVWRRGSTDTNGNTNYSQN